MKKKSKRKLLIRAVICLACLSLLMTAGCSKSKPPAQAMPAPEVEVVQVEQKDIPIYGEWIGALDGMVNAEIKAQVSGYLLKQNYTEGSFVRKGQLLFQIDPRPLQAALDQAGARIAEAEGQLAQANGQFLQAKAQLAQAEADQGKAQLDVNRLTPLAKEKAVTEQELDNALQNNLAARAKVEAAQAGVETAKAAIVAAKASIEAAKAAAATARLNLSFTRIVSPISGIAGLARAQIGNLVSASGDSLTTVSTVDPIKSYFTVTEQEYLQYTRDNPNEKQRQARERQITLELVLADGSVYPRKGKFFVADREVNTQTGSIRLAGLFPNPGNILRPGQYGRVRAVTETKKSALLVPQRAVTELQGKYQVAVVGDDNKVSIRPVTVGERIGSMWIIEDGLKPGERVIVEGTQKVRPDAIVNPKPFAAPPALTTQ
ncbi:MAG: efflux RND transporter periplasmic adaptor subunit [Blastocatellia bacterium]